MSLGTFSHPIELGDREGRRFQQLEALADTGASYTVAPAALLQSLGVQPTDRIELELADGRVVEREVGEATIRVDGRSATTIVIFGEEGDPALLGAHALEGVSMAVDPVRRRLVPTRAILMMAIR